jgi:hypothetical protein
MSARVTWTGLAELRDELRRLPAELAGEASGIVLGAAEGAAADMDYPRRTGDLADKLKVETVSSGPFGAGARFVNTSKLAHIFENGSQVRHTAIGANRGSMPPGHVFVPAVVRRRRTMYEQLKALLTRHGLQVSGDV